MKNSKKFEKYFIKNCFFLIFVYYRKNFLKNMRFRIQTDILKKAIDSASRATSSGNLTPILENILIDAGYNRVVFTGNSLEMSIEVSVTEGVEIEQEGSFTLSAKFLQSYIALVSNSHITFDHESGDNITLSTDNGKTKLKGIPADKFPSIPSIPQTEHIRISASELRSAIEKTLFSSADSGVRPMLAGIFMNPTEEKLIFASTDSFRLSDYFIRPKNPISHPPIIIPKKTATELSHLINQDNIDEVEIFTHETQMFVNIGNIKLTSRLLSGKFPEYNNFFPKEYNTRTTVLRSEFINALRQVNLVASKNNFNTRIRSNSDGRVEIFTGDTEIGASNRMVMGTIEGQEETIGMNSEYLLNALSVIKDDYVSFEYKNPLSPVVVRGVGSENKTAEEYRHLIMPLKI